MGGGRGGWGWGVEKTNVAASASPAYLLMTTWGSRERRPISLNMEWAKERFSWVEVLSSRLKHPNFPELQTEGQVTPSARDSKASRVPTERHLILTVSFTRAFLSLRLERG